MQGQTRSFVLKSETNSKWSLQFCFFIYFSDAEQELSIKINKKSQKQLYENGAST